jgi:glutaredoxin
VSAGGTAVLVLLSKPGCHLCERLRGTVERVLPEFDAALVEKDVREDAELERRYATEIPVLLLGDREVTRHRATEPELRTRLIEIGVPRR